MNRLHVILGLVRLEEYDRLSGYIAGLLGDLRAELGALAQRIKDPLLAGFLMARCSAAREQDIAMVLTEASQVPVCADEAVARDLVTILGKLLENAVEAMALQPPGRSGWTSSTTRPGGLGGGGHRPRRPGRARDRLFEKGFTTKPGDPGVGLYLTAQKWPPWAGGSRWGTGRGEARSSAPPSLPSRCLSCWGVRSRSAADRPAGFPGLAPPHRCSARQAALGAV